MLGFGSYRTAWFMAHRIREGMAPLNNKSEGPLGGPGKIVEADTTYIGGRDHSRRLGGVQRKGENHLGSFARNTRKYVVARSADQKFVSVTLLRPDLKELRHGLHLASDVPTPPSLVPAHSGKRPR